ncbi:MAG: hypothetical protein KGN16_26410 [Burkholderiales bacterium]|nr:hypothetical protein [Burkholderiales bacterium]
MGGAVPRLAARLSAGEAGDFDVSPYFVVIKPMLAQDFDHHRLAWRDPIPEAAS